MADVVPFPLTSMSAHPLFEPSCGANVRWSQSQTRRSAAGATAALEGRTYVQLELRRQISWWHL